MKSSDILLLSLHTIRSNRLRSGITVAIIALGITALVGIVTAIEAMNQKLTESFSTIGANGFTIRTKERNFRMGGRQEIKVSRSGQKQEKNSNLGQPITLQQAEAFREHFQYPAMVGISCSAGNMYSVATSARRTNPTVSVFGGDVNNLELNGNEIFAGRNFTQKEVEAGSGVCILGYDVASRLFGEATTAVGKEVRLQNNAYRVIAVLKSRGSTFGFSRDNIVIINYRNLVRNFSRATFTIGVKASALTRVEEAMGEAEGTFRTVRKLAVTEETNFVLERSNSLAEKAINSLRYITVAVTLIGLITLIGAAIGLMNIMLVAVAERTKEIGLAKAIGAKRNAIRLQFLSEAVLISLAGAVIGIGIGIILGNLVSLLLHTQFVIPWNWIIYGVIICTIVGFAAGIYPAVKAGRLNPIEALRYE
ncbi:MAG TPA: ABC transporter permease [Flavisolibacter sp.]|nr:ABC transporter permease [Flavisolibacter sp.]